MSAYLHVLLWTYSYFGVPLFWWRYFRRYVVCQSAEVQHTDWKSYISTISTGEMTCVSRRLCRLTKYLFETRYSYGVASKHRRLFS